MPLVQVCPPLIQDNEGPWSIPLKKHGLIGLAFIGLLLLAGCNGQATDPSRKDLGSRKIRVVTTVGMITDIVRIVGDDRVEVTGLMGPGVDPHLYKASEGDVGRMAAADVI